MYKIAVMGDYDSVYGFGALGMETFPITEIEDGVRTLRTLAKSEYGIIYITEKLAKSLENEIEKYSEMIMPAIIQIPGTSGNTGMGIENIKKSVEQAVGSDILFGSK